MATKLKCYLCGRLTEPSTFAGLAIILQLVSDRLPTTLSGLGLALVVISALYAVLIPENTIRIAETMRTADILDVLSAVITTRDEHGCSTFVLNKRKLEDG